MKRLLACLIALQVPTVALAQAAPSGQKTLAATMNVHAFPKKGQPADQQSKDEAACYDYAVGNTGTDPFELKQQSQQQAQQAEAAKQQAQAGTAGAGVRGAVGGAVAGAVVGEIAGDDAGQGAAVGAAVGAVANRRRAKNTAAAATTQADAQKAEAQAATAEQLLNFKKAFSVCLEAKDYMVKF